MSVMFKTQQGRTLVAIPADEGDVVTLDEFTTAIGTRYAVSGYEMGDPEKREFVANTRQVVEWWDEPRRTVTLQDIVGVAS